jgi:hypothetical protein
MTHAEGQQVTATHAMVVNLFKSCGLRLHCVRIVNSKHETASILSALSRELERQKPPVFCAC